MQVGIDRFETDPGGVIGIRNILLVTGSSNVNSAGTPVYSIVKKHAGDQLKAIWSLQHGFFVDKQDNMILSDSFYWKDLDIEIKSLYGEKLLPEEHWLKDVDALVIDILDVGTRVYTFVNQIVMIMKFLSGKGIDIIVLDRPNPLNGLAVEGNVMEADYFSIVGQLPVPMRHGLTTGEFLSYALSYYDIDLQLEVVKVTDWERDSHFQGMWTYPSPNMPTFDTSAVYPGAVLLEGTNLSEGRGTTRPFEFVGAPFIDNLSLVKELEGMEFPGVVFVPVFFKPEFSKYSGEVCKGVFVRVRDFAGFGSYRIYYEIIRIIRSTYPDQFKWKEPPYEFEYTRPPIDMICGSASIRKAIEKNIPFAKLNTGIEQEVQAYLEGINEYLLY
ncbi:MAG: DUF1343 domain-containing protein [bacterium]|nr:DUF1343 domain-containing protein [bacterium]